MARRKPKKIPHRRRQWSLETVNTGPTIITSPRLGAGASLRSVARGDLNPELHEGEFGLSEPRVANRLLYVKLFRERLEYMRIKVLDRGPISCLYLLFRGQQWMWMKEEFTLNRRRVSIVYASREHARLVLECSNICWKHEEVIDEHVRNVHGGSGSNSSGLGLYALSCLSSRED